jgi:hypothetical protein
LSSVSSGSEALAVRRFYAARPRPRAIATCVRVGEGAPRETETAFGGDQRAWDDRPESYRSNCDAHVPVKLKFENPFLGSACYIGSSSSPVVWPLTTGTTKPSLPNKPIKGTAGKLETLEGGKLEKAIGASLVENNFSAPGASGCGGLYSSLIDPIINAKIGLPAAAGTNTMILDGTVEFASAKAVVESE